MCSKKIKRPIFGILILCWALVYGCSASSQNSQNSSWNAPIIANYLFYIDQPIERVQYNAGHMPYDKFNRLYLAFSWIKDSRLTYWKDNNTEAKALDLVVTKTRLMNPHVKILTSSGYDSAGDMYRNADPVTLAKSVVQFLQRHDLDGYDMDWENGIDHVKMIALLQAVRDELNKYPEKEYLLTLAVWPDTFRYGSSLPAIAGIVDQINIMSYGSGSDLESITGEFAENGFPYAKMVGGIDTELGYDGPGGEDTLDGSIALKCTFARTNSAGRLAGMMSWRIDNDYSQGGVPTYQGALNMYKWMTE